MLPNLKKNEEKKALRLDGFTILLAEDSAPMQTLIASMLRSFGVGDVLVCNGGNEAIDLLKITQAKRKSSNVRGVDIILSDWFMPQGSGLDLLRWIRAHNEEEICYMPFVLLSAYTTEKVIRAARDNGAHEALVKPVSGSKLASRILSIIENPRPFVRTPDYIGPDRRRKDIPYPGPDRRVKDIASIKVSHEKH